MAIARFVARKSGLLGKDDLEVGRADMIAEQFQEYMDSKSSHGNVRRLCLQTLFTYFSILCSF